MDQEYIAPERNPRGTVQAFSPFGCFLAASGVTLLTFCLLGAAAAASVWAFSKMLGLPDIVIQVLLVVCTAPVLMATIWTAGRAWHIEQRLARGQDVDVPQFSTFYYWRGKA